MVEERTLLKQTIKMYEEIIVLKEYTSRIVEILQISKEATPEMCIKLNEIAIELYESNFEFTKSYQKSINNILSDLAIIDFDVKGVLGCFEEFLNELNTVLTFFDSEKIEKIKSKL